MVAAAAACVFCEDAVHDYLRQHPEDLLRLRSWRELRQDMGECPGCDTTLHIDWTPERRALEGVPSAEVEAAEDSGGVPLRVGAWVFVRFEDGCKGHAIPPSLVDGILADLKGRGHQVARIDEIEKAGIDRGGIARMNRPVVRVELPGLALTATSECLGSFIDALRTSSPRTTPAGLPYYKLHSHWNCVVLEPAHREALLREWASALPAAEVAVRAFYGESPVATTAIGAH